jgi:hypothetical protein
MTDPGKDGQRQPAPTRMVHGITRYDLAFIGLVCIALMALCVFSGTGTPLFIAAIGSGAALAGVWIRFRRTRHPSIKGDGTLE